MAVQTNGRVVEPEAALGSLPSHIEIRSANEALLVRVLLEEGVLELSVPLRALAGRPEAQHHIPGFNADAAPS